MKDFLENIIKNIVDNPDYAKVEETSDETGRSTLLISVNDADMGRVIGKSGKVINAIRTIIRIMAIRQGVRVRVDVKDARTGPDATTQTQTDSSEQTQPETQVQPVEPDSAAPEIDHHLPKESQPEQMAPETQVESTQPDDKESQSSDKKSV